MIIFYNKLSYIQFYAVLYNDIDNDKNVFLYALGYFHEK